MKYLIHHAGAWVSATPKAHQGGTWVPLGKQAAASTPVVTGTALWPEPLDETAAAFRPVFAPAATFEVGAGKQYATITEAITAANAYRGSARPAPDNRLDILIYPGTYRENIKPPHYSALIGMGSREEVIIHGVSNGPHVGIVDTSGACFIENLTIIHPAENARFAPKYPVHAAHNGVLTFINCLLDGQAPSSGGGGTAFGADGGHSGWVIGYKSELRSLAPAATTNSHGPNSGPGVMADYWIDCTFSGAVAVNSIDTSAFQLHLLGATRVAGGVTAGGSAEVFLGEQVTVAGARPAGAKAATGLPVLVDGMNPVEAREYYGG